MASLAKHYSMTVLVRRYLAHRRRLGYALHDGELLLDFAGFVQRVSPGQPITTTLALDWARSTQSTRQRQAARLSLVRGFAKYCAIFDSRTQIPDGHLLGPVCVRLRPHIYTLQQVRLILRRTRSLPKRFTPLQPLTYETLIGLLACTGLRSGEARRLRLSDFDADTGRLRIARCKFSAERTIPLHPSTVAALQHYRQLRRQFFPTQECLFVGKTGQPLQDRCVYHTFTRLTAGLRPNGDRPTLRLTDFRHSFASHWIAEWGRQAKPISHYLLLLARYLGHRDFNSTWWYVSSDPNTLQHAARSFQRFHEKGQTLHEA